jgi:hypothetical protein
LLGSLLLHPISIRLRRHPTAFLVRPADISEKRRLTGSETTATIEMLLGTKFRSREEEEEKKGKI